MLKRHVTVVVVLVLGFVLGDGTLAFPQDQKQGAPPLRQIHAAAKALEQAQNHLEKANTTSADTAPRHSSWSSRPRAS